MRDTGGWRPDLRGMDCDMPFQRPVRRMQRIAWLLMPAVLALVLAGAFGRGGRLAAAERNQGGVTVEWARIQRLGAPIPLRVTLPPGDGAIRLDSGFLRSWRLREVTPQPRAIQAGPDGARLLPAATDAGATVVMEAEPRGWPGPRRLRIRAGGQDFDLPVLVWP